MAIIRRHYDQPFAMISKKALEDNRLSWKARGLLVYLVSKPADWSVYVNDLVKRSPDGKKVVYTCLNELINLGYVERVTKFGDGHRCQGVDYIVSDISDRDHPEVQGNI